MTELFQRLTTHESLLAIGVSGVIFGLILRTFASSSRRSAALRQQHQLHDHKLGDAIRAGQDDRSAGWFEKHVSAIANTVVFASLAIIVLSWFRN